MPHMHLETTADLNENADIPDILEALCLEMARQPAVESPKIRAYHTLRSVWQMGEGAPPSFAHLTVFVQSGFDLSWRRETGEALMQVLKERLEYSLSVNEVAITLDVREMERDTHQRLP